VRLDARGRVNCGSEKLIDEVKLRLRKALSLSAVINVWAPAFLPPLLVFLAGVIPSCNGVSARSWDELSAGGWDEVSARSWDELSAGSCDGVSAGGCDGVSAGGCDESVGVCRGVLDAGLLPPCLGFLVAGCFPPSQYRCTRK
jgi:hypothetical protein